MPSERAATRDVVRAVAERDLEAPARGPAPQRERAVDEAQRLRADAAAAVAADDLGVETVALGERDGLREVARGDLARRRRPRAGARSPAAARARAGCS